MKDITCRFILHNKTRLPGRSRFYGMAKVTAKSNGMKIWDEESEYI